MSKWIAEFDLEDGDTMPEHMELEYKGAIIDFHCKPLEQQPVLDKIRAEIEAIEVAYGFDKATKYGNKNAEQQSLSYSTMMMYEVASIIDDIKEIIDKYRESEE